MTKFLNHMQNESYKEKQNTRLNYTYYLNGQMNQIRTFQMKQDARDIMQNEL